MRILVCFILIFFGATAVAQELNCRVTVTSNPALDITTKEKEILGTLQESLFDFMNSTVWTDDRYEVEERINCVFQLSITKVKGGGSYEAQLQVKATRPVYNTSYNTTLLNILDKDVRFQYQQNAKLIFSKNQFSGNLTSIFAFYAYYILGLDGDSFIKDGGTIYFEEAQNIVSLAQSSGGAGWNASDNKKQNRYWLINNRLESFFKPLRICSYEYHRKGLDQLYENKEQGQKAILDALNKLLKITRSRPTTVNVANFMRCKRDELIGLFENDPDQKEKTDAMNLFKRLDPSNSQKYQQIGY